MVSIKILGTGCPKCQKLEAMVREYVDQNQIDATIEKVTDIDEMMNYGIMMSPGLVINEEVKSFGRVPEMAQLKELI